MEKIVSCNCEGTSLSTVFEVLPMPIAWSCANSCGRLLRTLKPEFRIFKFFFVLWEQNCSNQLESLHYLFALSWNYLNYLFHVKLGLKKWLGPCFVRYTWKKWIFRNYLFSVLNKYFNHMWKYSHCVNGFIGVDSIKNHNRLCGDPVKIIKGSRKVLTDCFGHEIDWNFVWESVVEKISSR